MPGDAVLTNRCRGHPTPGFFTRCGPCGPAGVLPRDRPAGSVNRCGGPTRSPLASPGRANDRGHRRRRIPTSRGVGAASLEKMGFESGLAGLSPWLRKSVWAVSRKTKGREIRSRLIGMGTVPGRLRRGTRHPGARVRSVYVRTFLTSTGASRLPGERQASIEWKAGIRSGAPTSTWGSAGPTNAGAGMLTSGAAGLRALFAGRRFLARIGV